MVPQLEPLLDRPESELRFHATLALLEIDSGHKRAADELVRFVTDVGNSELAKHAHARVIRLGAAFVPKLLPKLDDGSAAVRIVVLETLAAMRHQASSAIELLVTFGKKESDAKVRKQLVLTLAKVGTREQVEAPLRTFLKDSDDNVVITTSSMLRYFGAIESPTAGQIQAATLAEDDKPLRSLLSE